MVTPTFSAGFLARNRVRETRLADHTTMRIGGPACLVELHERQDLGELLALPHRWLGKGANLLIGDAGADDENAAEAPATTVALDTATVETVCSAARRTAPGSPLPVWIEPALSRRAARGTSTIAHAVAPG